MPYEGAVRGAGQHSIQSFLPGTPAITPCSSATAGSMYYVRVAPYHRVEYAGRDRLRDKGLGGVQLTRTGRFQLSFNTMRDAAANPGPAPQAANGFTSQAGRFSINLPGVPQHQTKKHPGGVATEMFELQHKGGSLFVTYSDLPLSIGQTKEAETVFFDSTRDGGIKAVNAVLLKENNILVSGHPGRNVEASIGLTRIRFQMILVNHQRLYTVMAVGPESWAHSEEINNVLSSFSIQSGK